MSESKYEVYVGRERIAYDITYKTASILIKGLLEEYYDEPDTQISILRMRDDYEEDEE